MSELKFQAIWPWLLKPSLFFFSFLLLSISDSVLGHPSHRAPRSLIFPWPRWAPSAADRVARFLFCYGRERRWGRPGLVRMASARIHGEKRKRVSKYNPTKTRRKRISRKRHSQEGASLLLLNLVCFVFHGSVVVCRPTQQLPIFSTWLWCISTFNSQNSIWLFRVPIFSTSIFLEGTCNTIYRSLVFAS